MVLKLEHIRNIGRKFQIQDKKPKKNNDND